MGVPLTNRSASGIHFTAFIPPTVTPGSDVRQMREAGGWGYPDVQTGTGSLIITPSTLASGGVYKRRRRMRASKREIS